MRQIPYCKNNCSLNLITTIIITIIFISAFVLLYSTPVHAQTPNPALKLNHGWQYRWDNFAYNGSVPAKFFNPADNSGWTEYKRNGDSAMKRDKNYTTAWIRIKLPDTKWDNANIYFITVVCEQFDVFIDGKSIYTYKQPTPILGYSKYMLNTFLLPLPDNYDGKVMVLRVYSDIDVIGFYRDIWMGSHSELIKMMMKTDLDNAVISFFFIVFGVFMLPNVIFLSKRDRKSLLSLSFFIISLGLWFISQDVNIKLLFFEKSDWWGLTSNLSIFCIPIFLIYFFEQIFGPGYKSIIRILWKFHVGIFITFIVFILWNLFMRTPVGSEIKILETVYFVTLLFAFGVLVTVVIKHSLNGEFEARIFAGSFAIFSSVSLYELSVFLITKKTPFIYKWIILVFIASLILILGRRFSDVHKRLIVYSNELESKNEKLNHMWQEVKQSRDEIEQLNKTLENRVIERTQQLESANEEQKKTLDTLMKTQAQLIQSEKMAALGGLVAGIAHEINTPVGIGVTAASHLENKTKEFADIYDKNELKRADFENYLSVCKDSTIMILSNLKRASDLIKSFKKVAVDQSSEIKRKFKAKDYINEVLMSLSPKLKKVKHHISVNCPDDIEIDGYPGAFSQIITNLVFNSILHAYDDGKVGNIVFNITQEDDTIIFKYSDDGKGIDSEIIDKIFDPFFTTKRSKGGTGLGLNILYNIVTQTFEGTVKCESTLGSGTTFIITFPVSR